MLGSQGVDHLEVAPGVVVSDAWRCQWCPVISVFSLPWPIWWPLSAIVESEPLEASIQRSVPPWRSGDPSEGSSVEEGDLVEPGAWSLV